MTCHCMCGIKEVECDYPNCKNGEWNARKSKPHISQAVHDVLSERCRQIAAEGWTPEHDDHHVSHELAEAAACYCLASVGKPFDYFETMWPWEQDWFKSSTPRRDLVKAAALILAEIERLDRIQPPKGRD